MADTMNRWDSIREGANDVERLIGQKQYNLAMIKARQTLEIMVNVLAERCELEVSDLKTTIDQLYRAGMLSRTSAEHYHKIRMIGNKAAHEADDNPSGANTAYHLLSQEMYTFAHDYGNRKPVRRTRASAGERGDDEVRVRRSSGSRRSGNREKVFIIVALILIVLLIAGIIKLLGGKKSKPDETEAPTDMQIAVETVAPAPETIPEPETEAPTEAEKQYVVSANTVNVREAPNTDCKILTQLHEGDPIKVIEEVDVEWFKIDLDGTEAYINRQYIKEQVPEDGEPENSEPDAGQ